MAQCKNVQDLKPNLECPICLERVKEPRMLPCLHSFCEKCLDQHIQETKTNTSFLCPICKTEEFQVPTDEARGFCRNIYLSQISELFPEQSVLECEFCKLRGTESVASSVCLQCAEHLCEKCTPNHCLTKATFDHRPVSLEEVRNGKHFEEIRRYARVYCSVHPQELLNVFCHSCQIPICVMCSVVQHNKHNMQSVEEASEAADVVMRELLDPWEKAAEHWEGLSAERKQVLDDTEELERKTIGRLDHMFSEFLNEVNLQKSMYQGIVKQKVNAIRKKFDVAYEEAEACRVSCTETVKYVSSILDCGQDVEKSQQFRDIQARLKQFDVKKLRTAVAKPTFEIKRNTLALPRLKLKTILERKDVVPSLSSQVQKIVFKENATEVTSFSTLHFKDSDADFAWLSVTDDWFLTVDCNHRRVNVFDRADGSFLFEVNQSQQKLQKPRNVTCNDAGEIFVTDDGINGIVKYDKRGQMLKVAKNLYMGNGFVVYFNDQLFVTDCKGKRILIVDCEYCEVIKRIIDKGSLEFTRIHRDCVGYYDNYKRPVYNIIPCGGPTSCQCEFIPVMACVNKEGQLVVVDSFKNRVHVIDCNRAKPFVRTLRKTFDGGVRGVCADEWGNILVSDCGNTQIVLITAASEETRVILSSDQLKSPCSIAVTELGEVIVLDPRTGNIKVYQYIEI